MKYKLPKLLLLFLLVFVYGLFSSNVLAVESCNVDNDGLVSYWSFDEVDGDVVHDQVGSNDGVLLNGPQLVPGKLNNALSFDGVDDEVRVHASDDLNISGDVSLSLWMKRNSIEFKRQILIDKGAGHIDGVDAPASFLFGVTKLGDPEGANRIFTGFERDNGSNSVLSSETEIDDLGFYHLLYVRDGFQHSLYIDGNKESSENFLGIPGDTSNIDLLIGALRDQVDSSFAHFHGVIDEVRIYNRALSECEVQGSYEGKYDNTSSLDVPFFSQNDDLWGDNEYDSASSWVPEGHGDDIDRWGCAMTSSAMILKYYGYDKGVNLNSNGTCGDSFDLDPGSLNEWLIDNNGYDSKGALYWYQIGKFARNANNCLYNNENYEFEFRYGDGTTDDYIRSELEKSPDPQPGVLRLKKEVWSSNLNRYFPQTHFVVPVGFDNEDNLLINDSEQMSLSDPAPSLDSLYSDYERDAFMRFVQSHTDLSGLVISADTGVNLEVVYNDSMTIPENSGVEEFSLMPDGIANSDEYSPIHQIFNQPKPTGGATYLVKLAAEGGQEGLKEVDIRLFDVEGNQSQLLVTRLLGEGETEYLIITLADDLSGITDASVVSYEMLIGDLKQGGALGLIDPSGVSRGTANQVKAVQKLDKWLGIDKPASKVLVNVLKKVEKSTPDKIDSDLSNLLVWEIESLLGRL